MRHSIAGVSLLEEWKDGSIRQRNLLLAPLSQSVWLHWISQRASCTFWIRSTHDHHIYFENMITRWKSPCPKIVMGTKRVTNVSSTSHCTPFWGKISNALPVPNCTQILKKRKHCNRRSMILRRSTPVEILVVFLPSLETPGRLIGFHRSGCCHKDDLRTFIHKCSFRVNMISRIWGGTKTLPSCEPTLLVFERNDIKYLNFAQSRNCSTVHHPNWQTLCFWKWLYGAFQGALISLFGDIAGDSCMSEWWGTATLRRASEVVIIYYKPR